MAAYKKAWCERNREHKRAKAREWYLKNKDKTIARAKARFEADPEAHRKRMRENYLDNMDAYKKRAHVRGARLRKATPCWDLELTELVFSEALLLSKQREQETGFPWEVDHIVPIKGVNVCGLHVWNNFQVISRTDNRRKKNYHVT